MEYFDIFAELGLDFGAMDNSSKEEEKQKKSKSGNKGTNKGAGKDDKIKLPVEIYTGYQEPIALDKCDFGSEEVFISDIHKNIEKYFPEYPSDISILEKGINDGKEVLYLFYNKDLIINKNIINYTAQTVIFFANHFFCLEEMISSNIGAEEVDIVNGNQIEPKKLARILKKKYSIQGDLGFIYSAKSDVVVTCFTNVSCKTITLNLPLNIVVPGKDEIIINTKDYNEYLGQATDDAEDSDEDGDEDDNLSDEIAYETVCDMVQKKYPEFGEKHLELLWDANSKCCIAQMGKSTTNNKKASEEMFPTDAVLHFLYTSIQLSPEMFDGATSISKKDLHAFIVKDRPEFGLETTEITYDKNINYIVVTRKSSKKGIEVVYYEEEYLELINSDEDLLFIHITGYERYRVEKNKICTIEASLDEFYHDRGTFKMNIPKVPKYIYNMADAIFKSVFDKYGTEATLYLYWDTKLEQYRWLFPYQKATENSCIANNPILPPRYMPVGQFHSHGKYDAYFSSVDDSDELGFGIFGVFGSYLSKERSFRLRAGTGGKFVDLSYEDVFSDEDISIAEGEVLIYDVNIDTFLDVD